MTKEIEAQLNKLQPTRPGAWLKPLLPLIDEQIRNGVSRQAIVDLLQHEGKTVTFPQLCKALYRWRKGQNSGTPSQATKQPIASTTHPKSTCTSALRSSSSSSPLEAADITSKSDLAKLRDTETPDLNSLAALARQHRKENKS